MIKFFWTVLSKHVEQCNEWSERRLLRSAWDRSKTRRPWRTRFGLPRSVDEAYSWQNKRMENTHWKIFPRILFFEVFWYFSFRLKLFPFYHKFLFLAPTRRKWGENCVSQTNMADRKCGCKGIRSCLLCEGINTQNTDIITWVRIFYIEFWFSLGDIESVIINHFLTCWC